MSLRQDRYFVGVVVRAALWDGASQVVEAYRDQIPWEGLKAHFQSIGELMAAASYGRPNSGNPEDAIVKLLDLAIEEGAPGAFDLTPCCSNDIHFVSPIGRFIDAGFTRALTQFLEQGFDPRAPHGKEGLNAYEVATKMDAHAVLALFKSFEARRLTSDLLRQADLEAATPG